MSTPKLTAAQRRALAFFADAYGEGAAESWCDYQTRGSVNFQFLNHERTLDALERKGMIADGRITDAGRAALAVQP